MHTYIVAGGGKIEPRRKSLRLPYYDYSESGIYFITIVINGRKNLLGEIVEGITHPKKAAEMLGDYWEKLSSKFPGVNPGLFVVMPNHFHGLIEINRGTSLPVGVLTTPDRINPSLPIIVQWFKTMTTNAYVKGVKTQGWLPFNRRFWQRNYYEHIVRDDDDLARIMDYIENNPANWANDVEMENI